MPRQNPAPSPRLADSYARVRTAVEDGLRAIVDRGDGSSKIWQPVPPATVGSSEAEMDLLRFAIGEWRRTKLPYEACEVGFVEFMAFAYAAERACLAQREAAAAKVFEFIRSCPANAKRVAGGYAAPGGLSRVLMASREMNGLSGSTHHRVHATTEMLVMTHAADALVFARSELWPVGARWSDGWTAVDKRVRLMGPRDFAWRGTRLAPEKAASGLLIAGVEFPLIFDPLENLVLRRRDMRGAQRVKLLDCKLFDCDLRRSQLVVIDGTKLQSCDFRDAKEIRMNNCVAKSDFRGASFSSLMRSNVSASDLRDAYLGFLKINDTKLPKDTAGADFTNTDIFDTGPVPRGWTLHPSGRLSRG